MPTALARRSSSCAIACLALSLACGEAQHSPPDAIDPIEPGTFLWARGAGGTDDDEASAARPVSGGVLVAGSFRGEATFGRDEAAETTLLSAGSADAFLARYDAEGRLIWARADGGTSAERAASIAAEPDGGAWVTGSFGAEAVFGAGETQETTLQTTGSLDLFLARYDGDGALSWASGAGSFYGHDFGHGVAALPDGTLYVCGQFTDGAFFDQAGPNETRLTATLSGLFLARYGADGEFIWAKAAGGDGEDSAQAVAAAPDGGAFVAGWFSAAAAFGEGGGLQALTSAGGTDLFLARYAPDGALAWARRAGGAGDDRAAWVELSPGGDLLVAGSFSGSADFGDGAKTLVSSGGLDVFLAGYEHDGTLVWAASGGGADDDVPYGGAAGDDGAILTGSFAGNATFAGTLLQSTGGVSDLFVASWDGAGSLRWARSAGGSGVDAGLGAAGLADGSALAVGRFGTRATFGAREAGETSLNSQGAADVFLARYAP